MLRFIDTPIRMARRMMSFLGAIDAGFAPIWQRNLRAHHWLGKAQTDRVYIENVELGCRVTCSFDQR